MCVIFIISPGNTHKCVCVCVCKKMVKCLHHFLIVEVQIRVDVSSPFPSQLRQIEAFLFYQTSSFSAPLCRFSLLFPMSAAVLVRPSVVPRGLLMTFGPVLSLAEVLHKFTIIWVGALNNHFCLWHSVSQFYAISTKCAFGSGAQSHFLWNDCWCCQGQPSTLWDQCHSDWTLIPVSLAPVECGFKSVLFVHSLASHIVLWLYSHTVIIF